MPDMEKVIDEWETILNRDPLDVPWDLIDETLALLKEQEAEIRQLRLALDIAKGTCKGIKVERAAKLDA